MKAYLLGLVLLISACAPIVPATTPPQLDFTPGAEVVVTDKSFDAGAFRVDYPAGWRIVKTSIAADAQLQVVFVAPDGNSRITLTEVSGAGEDSATERYIKLDNSSIIQALAQAGDKSPPDFLAIFDQLVNSIRP